jgi:putative spermidine/putrescine transport system substrate-binding protein
MRKLGSVIAILFSLMASAAQAQSESTLTVAVYPGVTEEMWSAILARFTAETGIKARTFAPPLPAASVALAGGHPSFDVALIASYAEASLQDRGAIEPLSPEKMVAMSNVPQLYWPRNSDGTLMGVPLYFSIYGIAYNTDLATAADFSSWNNLLDSKWNDQISMNRPTMLAAYDLTLFSNVEPGFKFLEKIAANAHSVYSSMATFESELARGEVAAAPFYSAEIKLQKRKGAPTLGFTVPKEGGLMLSYLLVVPKGTTHMTEAVRFMNWMLEPEAQLQLAVGAGVWPMNSHVVLPATLEMELGGSVSEVMAHNYYPDWYVIGSAMNERTRRIESMIQKTK